MLTPLSMSKKDASANIKVGCQRLYSLCDVTHLFMIQSFEEGAFSFEFGGGERGGTFASWLTATRCRSISQVVNFKSSKITSHKRILPPYSVCRQRSKLLRIKPSF